MQEHNYDNCHNYTCRMRNRKDGYEIAIDEFAEKLKTKLVMRYGNATPTEQYVAMQVTDWIKEIAEQLKNNDLAQYKGEIMNRKFVESLVKLMQENPTLEVLCKVDSDIVAEDGYAWWLGRINDRCEVEIDEYTQIQERIVFKSEEEYTEWFEDMFDIDDFKDVPDDEWDAFCEKKVNEKVTWTKAIFIAITTV